MAPSAGWGKFVIVIFLLLFGLWSAYSRRRRCRRIQQLEQASAVGQTLGQSWAMAPSAGWGKFVVVFFLLLFSFWSAYSHRRRRIKQLEQASAVGQTLGQSWAMAPSAGWGKFVVVFFLLLFNFWSAYSRRRRRRRIKQLEQASAVGQTLGQIEVYTNLIGRTLKVYTWQWSINDLE